MKGIVGSLFTVLFALSSAAYAVDLGEVVVTGTYSEIAVKESGNTIEVVDAAEIEAKGYSTLSQVVKTFKGVDVSSNGVNGMTSIFVRGFDSQYTVVLVDGVRMSDPTSLSRTFDINGIDLNNVERIEFAKGIQSSAYGADAAAAVINVITKKGSDDTKGQVGLEFGSHDSFRETAALSGTLAGIKYSLSASRFDSDGISSAAKTDANFVSENDGVERTDFRARVDYDFNEDISLALSGWYNINDLELDNGAGADDPNQSSKAKQGNFAAKFKHSVSDLWKYNLQYTTMSYKRIGKDDADNLNMYDSATKNIYKGRNESFSMNNSFDVSDVYKFNIGYQYDKERSYTRTKWSSDRGDTYNRGYYLENKFKFLEDKLNANLFLRADDHSKFGTYRTFKADASYLFETGTRLKANWGRGFKAPSLYQLYSGSYGNVELNVEEIDGFEFGFEQELLEGDLDFGLTYFHNEITNKISWVSTGMFSGQYFNVAGETKTEGIEFFTQYALTDNFDIGFDYTYTEAKDKNGQPLLRRARNKYGLSLDYRFLDKGTVSFDIARYVGRRGYSVRYLKNYTKADLALNYDINENINIYARIENLFDEVYYLAYGYSTEGRSLYSGLRFKF